MNYQEKPKGYYDNVRNEMIKYMPKNPKTIIDVGCGDGSFGQFLKKETKAEVWGIEYMDDQATIAKDVLDKVFSGPCEDYINDLPDNYFEVIYFNDVLEHLVDPYAVLKNIKSKLTNDGVLISSIPNVRYHGTFSRLLFKKDWLYEDFGVMDFTHLRFFTSKSIKRMYKDAGYQIVAHEGINRSRSLKPILYNLPVLFSQTDIFYPQFATVGKK